MATDEGRAGELRRLNPQDSGTWCFSFRGWIWITGYTLPQSLYHQANNLQDNKYCSKKDKKKKKKAREVEEWTKRSTPGHRAKRRLKIKNWTYFILPNQYLLRPMRAHKGERRQQQKWQILNPAQFLSKLTQSLYQKTSRTYAYFQAYNILIFVSTDLYNI